jgi:hypothetical protein
MAMAMAMGPAVTARTRVAHPSSFINFSIDAPTVHLFKFIECSMNFQYGTNQIMHRSIVVGHCI